MPTIDISQELHRAYYGSAGRAAKPYFDAQRTASRNTFLGEQLARVIVPQVTTTLRDTHSYYSCMPDAKAVESALLFPEHQARIPNGDFEFGFTLYDLGAADGQRAKQIANTYREHRNSEMLDINKIVATDLSTYFLEQAYKTLRDIPYNVRREDLRDFNLEPIYRETNQRIEYDLRTAEPVEATCKTRLERSIVTLLGNTINNMEQPLDLIKNIGRTLSPLDLFVLEWHYEGNYDDYPEKPRQFIYDYVAQLGFTSEHTHDGENITATNSKQRTYQLNLAADFVVPDDHPLNNHQNFKPGTILNSGTSILLGYNKPLPIEQVVKQHVLREDDEDSYLVLDPVAYSTHNKDAIAIFRQNNFYHSGGSLQRRGDVPYLVSPNQQPSSHITNQARTRFS